jgi:hypothetical protein
MVWAQGGGTGANADPYQKKAAQDAAAALAGAFQMPDMGGFQFDPGNVDYMAMAKQMFAPQTGYLDQQASAAQQRGAQNDKQVAGMYGQTVKDILAMAGGINKNFAGGQQQAGAAYNQAMGDVGAAYDKSRNDSMAILQRLGIQQAAPEMLEQNAGDRAFIQSVLAANNQGTQNMLGTMKQGALTFNTEQGNITRQMGAEARTNMKRGLEDTLAQIAAKKADVQSQIAQQGLTMRGDAEKSAYDRYKDERDFNYGMAKDRADLDLKRMSMSGQDEGATDPLGKVYALANSVYGNTQSASNAVRLVSEAMTESKPTNAAQFIQAVMDRAHRANGQVNDEANLQRLAAMMFNEMYGKQSPNSGQF